MLSKAVQAWQLGRAHIRTQANQMKGYILFRRGASPMETGQHTFYAGPQHLFPIAFESFADAVACFIYMVLDTGHTVISLI